MNDILNVSIDGLMVGPSNPVRVMSVINLSPESFYKGGIADSTEKFHEMMKVMLGEGADIIDIGGASTAPQQVYGTSEVMTDEEIKRVSQALESIDVAKFPPISIDTTSSEVAEIALDLGVSMVNDISGLHADSGMGKLVADRGVPIVLMANCGAPCESVKQSLSSLEDSLAIAERAGVKEENIILDPGIGFGKPPDVDITILQGLSQYTRFNHPLLVGVSRKAFIGHILDQPDPESRLTGSIVATAVAVMNGADIIRTHDVRETRVAVQMGEALRRSQ